MRREVFALVVSCTFMEDGCKWKGEVRHLEVCEDDAEKTNKQTRDEIDVGGSIELINRAN